MGVDLHDLTMCPATLMVDPMTADRASFEQAMRASADAGFTGVALWGLHTASLGLDVAGRAIADAGLHVPVLEGVFQWAFGSEETLVDEAKPALDLATTVGARAVLACVLEPELRSIDDAITGFARLAGLAAERDLQVCLEFLPWTAIPDLRTAWRVIEAAGADNGGLVLDLWHWARQPGGASPEALALLRQIPPDKIHYIQLGDVAVEPAADMFDEAMTARLVPGAGCIDFGPPLAAALAGDSRPIVAPEVFNSALAAHGAEKMARTLADACASILAPFSRPS